MDIKLSCIIAICLGLLIWVLWEYLSKRSEMFTDGNVKEINLYYALWCGYSREFLPEWQKFEKYSKEHLPNLVVTKVRCEDGNEAICNQKNIQGYPTVTITLKDGTKKTFNGERTSESLIKFIKQYEM